MFNEDNVAGQADGEGSPAVWGSTDAESMLNLVCRQHFNPETIPDTSFASTAAVEFPT